MLLFIVLPLSFIRSLVPRNVLGSGGRKPLKYSGGGEGGRATPLKPPLTVSAYSGHNVECIVKNNLAFPHVKS